jgi:uncharacterized membrane protein YeaQ/YmgE (transglycosylase-associated protein family)
MKMIASILIGLIAGWLAGKLLNGEGYGVVCDILLGLIGGVIGAAIFAMVGLHAHGAIGAIIIATSGAVGLVTLSRVLTDEL